MHINDCKRNVAMHKNYNHMRFFWEGGTLDFFYTTEWKFVESQNGHILSYIHHCWD